MKNKFDKFIFLAMVPIFIVISICALRTSITATHGTQPLSEDEITRYVEYGENVLQRNFIETYEPGLKYKNLTKNSVTVYSNNMFKQVVIITSEDNVTTVEVKDPNINYIGCTLFFILFSSLSATIAILFLFVAISEFKNENPQNLLNTQRSNRS